MTSGVGYVCLVKGQVIAEVGQCAISSDRIVIAACSDSARQLMKTLYQLKTRTRLKR
jgi:hypothetical protein